MLLRAHHLKLVTLYISSVCFLHSLAPEAQVRKLILKNTPQYDFSHNRLIGLVDLHHSWALPSILFIVGTALPCTLIGDCCIVSSPLLTMYFVRPYRRQIERMVGLRSEKVRTRSQWTENRKEDVSEMSFSKLDPGHRRST
ncbi:hypothetical protein PRIPAC_77588 [Pristionchus pacificus]|nr:hypothetical protein PRIPAC_77588 [Pristionchus pacificus]